MSANEPKSTKVDPSKPRTPTVRRILSEGDVVNRDTDGNYVVINDTNTSYVLYMVHDNGWIALLWGQPPGMNVEIPPDWTLRISYVDNNNILQSDNRGNQEYWYNWNIYTQANSTLRLSELQLE